MKKLISIAILSLGIMGLNQASANACVDAKIEAFHQEFGPNEPIRFDVLEEWEMDCMYDEMDNVVQAKDPGVIINIYSPNINILADIDNVKVYSATVNDGYCNTFGFEPTILNVNEVTSFEYMCDKLQTIHLELSTGSWTFKVNNK